MIEAANAMSVALSPVNGFNTKRILDLSLHRCPILLANRVASLEPRKSTTITKNVTLSEPFFNDHFPGHPAIPGVLMLEMLAQITALLALDGADHEHKEN